MKTIQLTKGFSTVVDDEDYEWLSKWIWGASKTGKHAGYYARRQNSREAVLAGAPRLVHMHREILTRAGVSIDNSLVDHKDRDTLNNQRENLRPCSEATNARNKGKQVGKYSSVYKGVHRDVKSNRWRASIEVNKKVISLGSHTDESAAGIAYNNAATAYFGEFARLNKIVA